jgi:hypothetical protein
METSGGSKLRQNHVEVVRKNKRVEWNRQEERGNDKIMVENKEKGK